MERWEMVRNHDFCVIKAQCKSLGLPEPNLTKGGFQHNTNPQTLWRRYKGAQFTKALQDLGHSSTIFETCTCNPRH